ncbi:MAG: hypothetical protein ACOCPM_07660 [Bacteroidales bacterium]
MKTIIRILIVLLIGFFISCMNDNSNNEEISRSNFYVSKKEKKALNIYNILKDGKISLMKDVTISPRGIMDDKYYVYYVWLSTEDKSYTLPNFNYYDSTKRLPENNWIVYGYDKLGTTDTTKIFEYAKAKSDSILDLYHKLKVPAITHITDDEGTTFTEFTIKPDYVLIYCEEGLKNIDNEYWQIFINDRATIIDDNWCYGSKKDISVP